MLFCKTFANSCLLKEVILKLLKSPMNLVIPNGHTLNKIVKNAWKWIFFIAKLQRRADQIRSVFLALNLILNLILVQCL